MRIALTWLFLACAWTTAQAHADEVLPAGFSDVVIAHYFTSPTACVQAPDGRVFVAEQAGKIWQVVGGVRQSQVFATLNADGYSDRGILGLCCDPAFASNHYLYVFYTLKATPSINVVSRLDASGATAVGETIIFQGDSLSTTFCNGGGLGFGPDGKLYVCSGDGEVDANAQSMSTTLGKLLRMNSDGSVPSDNPFLSTTTGAEQLIYARGFRNCFSFAINPSTGMIMVNDVRGRGNLQVVDQVTAGSDFGYPGQLGGTVTAPYSAPFLGVDYGTASNQAKSITGGVFYEPGSAPFPASYTGLYFFCDFSNGWLWTVDPTANNAVSVFGSGLPYPVDLTLGSDGSIYYIGRGDSALHNISYQNPTTTPQSQTISGFSAFAPQTYGAAALSITGVTGGGSTQPVVFVSSNPSIASVSGTTVTILAAGTASITASQAGDATYAPAPPVTQSLTISPQALTITTLPATRSYGAANPSFVLSASALVGSDALLSADETCAAGATSAPGTYGVTVANAVFATGFASNYTISYAAGTLQVVPAMLTLAGDSELMRPGDPVPALTYTLSGFVNGDSQASATTGAPSLSTTATSSSAVGTYPITVAVGSLVAANYTVAPVDGVLYVGTLLTVSADPQSVTYGSAASVLSYSVSGFINGDTAATALTGSPVLTTSATVMSQVGSYDISIAQGTLSAIQANTYVFQFIPGTLTVTPAPLLITASDQSMSAGSALPTLSASYAGFVGGEGPGTLSALPVLTTSASSASPAGAYAITVSGAVDPDYAISYQPGVLTITAVITAGTGTATGGGTTTGTSGTTTTTGSGTGATTAAGTATASDPAASSGSSSGGGCGLGSGGIGLIALVLVMFRKTVVPPTTRLVGAISGRMRIPRRRD